MLAGAAFIATGLVRPPGFWVSLAHAGAEAAVVGGLADWFAVTALFRHPLGLPIPRTAVLPKNKDRIGEGLGIFVERYFLAPEILATRLHALAPARHFAAWLAQPDNARLIAKQLGQALPYLIRSLEDREVRDFVARSFHDQLRETDLAPVLGRIIALLTESGQYDVLFDRVLDTAERALLENADRLYELVSERSRWWIPPAIDRRIAQKVIDGISQVLLELRMPDSAARAQFRDAVEQTAMRLVEAPEVRQRFNDAKNRLLEHPDVQAWLGAIWDELRQVFLDDLAAPTSRTREALYTALLSLGRTLAADEAMQARMDIMIEHVALAVVPWRGQIATLISEVVRSWDVRTVTERLELAMGSDLQYIRMNGTLVGACVGCFLFLVARFLL